MNYIKSYFSIALIIDNNKVYDYIINNKASKGRYIDYTIRRLIKSVVQELIKNKKIDSHKNVRLIINIDEQSPGQHPQFAHILVVHHTGQHHLAELILMLPGIRAR